MKSFADEELKDQVCQPEQSDSASAHNQNSAGGSIGFNSFKVSGAKNRLRNILNAPSSKGNTEEHFTAKPIQGYMKFGAPGSNTFSIRVSDTSPQETMANVVGLSRDNTPTRA